jgi:hypothetical protein
MRALVQIGGLFSRGHIYKLLSNPLNVGRIAHKGQVHEGQHTPIVTLDLWDEVQQSLHDHLGAARNKRTRQSSDALLIGKLYDDGGLGGPNERYTRKNKNFAVAQLPSFSTISALSGRLEST